MKKFLASLLLLPLALFGAAGDIKFAVKSSNNISWIDVILAKQNNALFGTDGNGVPIIVTPGSGLSLVSGVLTASGASPLTTKGDLFTYSTANARLPVGTDTYMLVADSSQTTGLRWVAQPSGTLPSQTGNAGKFLTTDGTNPSWATASGTGDVVGPASATDNAVARFNLTTGKLIQNSGVIINDSNDVSGINQITVNSVATLNGTVVLPAGNAATPQLYFSTDSTSGFYRPSANQVGVSSSGSAVALFTSTGIQGAIGQTTPQAGSFTTGTFSTTFTPPNGTTPTTSSAGNLAFDTNAWATGRGAIQVYDGTANTYVVAPLASDTPTNGQVPTWNTGGTVTWETPSTSSGTVTSVSVTTANGVSGSVANATTTPAITLTLGAINPSSIGATTPGTGAFTEAQVGALPIVLGASGSGFPDLGFNISHTGTTDTYNYQRTGEVASLMQLRSGGFLFQTAPTGTAGNPITFSTIARLWPSVGIELLTGGYINFTSTTGSSGYGFRDNSGVMEKKDSGGSWVPLVAVAPGSSGNVLTSNGTIWTSAAPPSGTLPSQTGNSGKFLTTDGTNASWATVSGSGTVTSVNITAPAAGITASGGPITSSGSITLALADDLAAVEGLSGTGLATRTASNTWTTRTITGTSNQITVTNGDGVSGNPTLSIPSSAVLPGSPTVGGTASTAAGGITTIDGTQTLTNKTISGSSNTITNVATSSIITQTAISSTSTPALTFAAGKTVYTMTTNANVTISASGYTATRQVDFIITADATRTIGFDTSADGWIWVEGAPTTIASGKTMWITTYCTGSTEGTVIAAYGVSL